MGKTTHPIEITPFNLQKEYKKESMRYFLKSFAEIGAWSDNQKQSHLRHSSPLASSYHENFTIRDRIDASRKEKKRQSRQSRPIHTNWLKRNDQESKSIANNSEKRETTGRIGFENTSQDNDVTKEILDQMIDTHSDIEIEHYDHERPLKVLRPTFPSRHSRFVEFSNFKKEHHFEDESKTENDMITELLPSKYQFDHLFGGSIEKCDDISNKNTTAHSEGRIYNRCHGMDADNEEHDDLVSWAADLDVPAEMKLSEFFL